MLEIITIAMIIKGKLTPFYEKLRMCHNGVPECVYVKDLIWKLLQGWKLGTCAGSGNVISSRSATGGVKDLGNMDEKQPLPKRYGISNYPNPFAGKSTIRYELPLDGKVSIKVYDMMGRAIATLVDQQKKAGIYTIDFNAGNTVSGSLFYRMVVESKEGRFEQTNKMIRIK